jgi:hypothetical protein
MSSLTTSLSRIFLKHPREVGMTYWQHAAHSLTFSGKFAKASLQSLIHAFSPNHFQSTTSDLTKSLVEQMTINKK